ncbi:hypothetical protein HHK36_021685 [Tetracentron sinense]|uniref:Lon N-terminal domain-containing protein n=1 Tax=Tetracentron sinense TaxID=13715 RepID=A0A834YXH7_TETSI|nr:hypothetical protein HHK36_021685 [Tetracentron sinense]
MEDERVLERERLQIEQIRELEMEELQIEEVEDNHYSSSDDSQGRGYGGEVAYAGYIFDTCLVSLPTYLGEVEDTHHGLAFLDGGAILNLPMFYIEGVVLFPMATLHLRVVQPKYIAAIERAIDQVDAPYTIGVVCVHRNPDDGRLRFATIGTTAETGSGHCNNLLNSLNALFQIRQYHQLEDGSLNVVTHGQHRFHLRRHLVDVEAAPCAEIQIIQEDFPLRTPRDAFGQLASVSNLWSCSLSHLLPSDASHVKQHGNMDGGSDSESMSDTSFESGLSPNEMRIHHSAVDSCNRNDGIDELTSSDNDEFVCGSEPQFERSHPDDSGGSSQSHQGERTGSKISGLGIAQFVAGRQSHKGEGWRKGLAARESNWLRRAPRSYWPHWVYRMYDSYSLARRAADMWGQIIGVLSMDDLVKKPDLLSFYIASKIPVSVSTRQELLEIDGISYRLRREIELLERFDRVCCKNCQTVIAKRSDMMVMSCDGPLGAFANPHRYVWEIMTLSNTNGLALIGSPVKDYSWFPGYGLNLSFLYQQIPF